VCNNLARHTGFIRTPTADSLWVITAYFNPAGYRRRLQNYRVFRKHLCAPLVTIELSFDGGFALGQEDAEVLVQLRGGDVMWQKERLLNIAMGHLPDSCEKVAWVDCDVVFQKDDWVERAADALERWTLIHLYDHRVNLPREGAPGDPTAAEEIPSAVFKHARGEVTDEDFRCAGAPLRLRSTVGMAWASPRWILDRHGLYDACILGGADRAILGAGLGRFDFGIDALKMTREQTNHYLAWARPFHASVKGRLAHIQGRCYHLWHGDLRDRRYEERLETLEKHAFDPSTDVALDGQGLWKWASRKQALHEDVRAYFASRREDGR